MVKRDEPKKRTRRATGEGSIFHNEKRGRWEARLTVGSKPKLDGEGKPLYRELKDGSRSAVMVPVRKVFVGRTRSEVVELLEKAKSDVRDGSNLIDASTTVSTYLDHWLTEVLPGTVSAGTLTNYSEVARYWINPHIGSVKLSDLTPQHVERMLRTLDQAGKSTNTQRLARSVLRRALRRAQQQGVLSRNVAQIADGVKVTKLKEGRALDVDQAKELLSYIANADNRRIRRLEPAWLTALSLGLRRGELLGLRWDDVELAGPTPLLKVRYSLKREGGKGLVIDAPKTSDSKRTLNLPDRLALRLSTHRTAQLEERLAAGPEWELLPLGHDLVFRTEFGKALDPDNFRQYTYRVTEAALGERWSPHELRHSAASILLAQGVPLEVVSETLGHSSIRITKDVYGHLMPAARKQAADAMNDALFDDDHRNMGGAR